MSKDEQLPPPIYKTVPRSFWERWFTLPWRPLQRNKQERDLLAEIARERERWRKRWYSKVSEREERPFPEPQRTPPVPPVAPVAPPRNLAGENPFPLFYESMGLPWDMNDPRTTATAVVEPSPSKTVEIRSGAGSWSDDRDDVSSQDTDPGSFDTSDNYGGTD